MIYFCIYKYISFFYYYYDDSYVYNDVADLKIV